MRCKNPWEDSETEEENVVKAGDAEGLKKMKVCNPACRWGISNGPVQETVQDGETTRT